MYGTRYISIALLDNIGRILLTSECINTAITPKFALSLESHISRKSLLMDEYDENLKQKLYASRYDFNIIDNTVIIKKLYNDMKKEIYIFVLKPKRSLTLKFVYSNNNPSIFLPLENIREFSNKKKIELSSCAEHTLSFIETINYN